MTNGRLVLIKACDFNLKLCSFVAEATWLALASYAKRYDNSQTPLLCICFSAAV